MDDAINFAEARCRLNECMNGCTRSDIDGGGCYVEAGIGEHLCGGIRVLLFDIGKQNTLTGGDAANDGLANRSGSDYNDHICHLIPIFLRSFHLSVVRKSSVGDVWRETHSSPLYRVPGTELRSPRFPPSPQAIR